MAWGRRRLIRTSRRGAVALVQMRDAPGANSLGVALTEALHDELAALERDPAVRVLVLAGGADFFAQSAWPGRCLAALGGKTARIESTAPTSGEMMASDRQKRLTAIGRLRAPVIAAVRGAALGEGCELALACDLIVAAQDSEFRLPQVSSGVIPGSGATQRLARAVGKARAMELVLAGEPFTGREALSWGLINRSVAPERVLPEALELARKLARQPPLALRAAKEAILRSQDLDLEGGLAFERGLFSKLMDTHDVREAMRARIEGRPPRFQGR